MIGDNIRKIRKHRGISAQKVADHLNISKSAYYKYEQNEREMPLNTAVELAMLFDVTVDYMVNLGRIKPNYTLDEASTHIINYLITEWEGDFNSMVQLLGTYASMPVEMRKDVAEHDIIMFVNGIEECDTELVKHINVEKCKTIVNNLKK